MTIGERIKLLREDLELNKTQLAKIVGTSDVTIHYWETGEIKSIGHKYIIRLCRALGCTADELLGMDEDE